MTDFGMLASTPFAHGPDPTSRDCAQMVLNRDLGDGFYMWDVYSWGMGTALHHRIVHLSEMADWRFYTDEDSWKVAGDGYLAAEKRRISEATAKEEHRGS